MTVAKKMASGCGEWHLCADWLVRCQILTRDQRAALPTASINDLHHALRDGVLICLLINRLRPTTINPKDFSQRPQMSQVGIALVRLDFFYKEVVVVTV